MNKILSFFMLIMLFCKSEGLIAQQSITENKYLLYTGFIYNNSYFDTRIFAELENNQGKQSNYTISTWALGLNPSEFISLKLGSISYSGIWSRFNNPAPSKIAPLKQAYNVQQRLIASMPTNGSSQKPMSVTFELTLPFIDISSFVIVNDFSNIFGGTGFSLPFNIQTKENPSFIKGNWTLAWKTINMQSKMVDSWYMDNKFFIQDYFHSIIQELSLQTQNQTILFSTGFSQSPFKDASLFLRTDYSFEKKTFLLNMQGFFSDLDYLGQTGNFIRDTVQLSINPQLRFNYFSGLLRSYKVGATAKTELQNGEDFFEQNQWILFFDVASEIELLFLSLLTTISISDLYIEEKKESYSIVVQDSSVFKIQSKILLRPWYFQPFERTWIFQSVYEKQASSNNTKGDLDIKATIMSPITIGDMPTFNTSLWCETNLTLDEIRIFDSFQVGYKINTELKTKTLHPEESIKFSALTELNIKQRMLKSVTTEFSVILSYK